MGELAKRILVAIFGIPLITGLTYLGGWYFFLLILIISLIAQNEFYQMQKKINHQPQIINGMSSGVILLLGIQTGEWFFFGAIFIVLLLFIHAFEMLRHHKDVSSNIGVTLVGIFYIPLFLGTLIYTKDYIDRVLYGVNLAGFWFIMILLVSIWICDTFAYTFGILFGRHKLYEKVSPKKTMEGAVAGLFGAILVLLIVKILYILPLTWPAALIIGSVIGLLGQTGDLVESWFKREAGVKDSSALLPGHGGMLDRFDSLIFLSPAMFLLASVLFK
jgi:phosphatidate cytidylyltransferase